jgi:uncharacterized protein YjbI with pentapeptide repeats
MTENENKLLTSLNAREQCELGSDVPTANDAKVIAGSFIRDILVGGMPAHSPHSYTFGVRLCGAYIQGPIDLCEGRNAEHGPLPPLLLENCVLEGNLDNVGEAVLNGRHACFSRLSLSGCLLGRVDLSDAQIEGDLAVDCVGPLDETRSCQLTARGATINGRINARQAAFRIPLDALIPHFGIADSAFDLTDAYVDSSLYLCPGFEAIGGVSVAGAKIEGNIWCLGAHLVKGAGQAFDGQSLTCRGVLSFSATDDHPTQIEGNIGLLAARVSNLVMQNVVVTGDGALMMSNATLSGNLQILQSTIAHIDLSGANVEGSIDIGALLTDAGKDVDTGKGAEPAQGSADTDTARELGDSDSEESPIRGIKAYGLFVKGDFSGRDFRGAINIDNSDIEGRFLLHAAELLYLSAAGAIVKGIVSIVGNVRGPSPRHFAIAAPNFDIGEDLFVDVPPCRIALDGSRVRNDLQVTFHKDSTRRRVFPFISAQNVGIDNNCIFTNATGTLFLNTSTIGGRLAITADSLARLDARDINVRGPTVLSGTLAQTAKEHKARFDGGQFGGEFHLKGVQFFRAPGTVPALHLNDANIERDLHISSVCVAHPPVAAWAAYDPLRFCFGSLPFYPGWSLYEAAYLLEEQTIGIIAFLRYEGGEEQLVLLPGNPDPILALNETGALKFETADQVARYLRFFCSHVWAEAGPFRIIESEVELGSQVDFSFNEAQAFHTINVKDLEHGKWACTALVAYDANLFDCSFTVDSHGKVVMDTDRRIGELKEEASVRIVQPLRLMSAKKGNNAAEPQFLVAGSAPSYKPVEPSAELTSLLQRLAQAGRYELSRNLSAIVSLTGLKAGAVRFPKENGWGKGIQVQLEGFDYGRIEVDPDLEQEVVTSFADASQVRQDPPPHDRQLARERNRAWLYLQFPDGDPSKQPEGKAFSPQPHEHLALLLRRQGEVDQAIEVTLDRLHLERMLTLSRTKRVLSKFMDTFFKHGLRPEWGIGWCLVFLLVGGIFFDYTNYGYLRWLPASSTSWLYLDKPVLVVDAAAVSPLIQTNRNGFGNPSMQLAANNDLRLAPEARCGEQVDPVLYPIDLFVPLLNLRQQDKCTITTRPSAFLFRFFKFLYTVTGSIFTSLTLLSIAGVLRRRIEQ